MKFDYLIVGSGLYGAVFAHEMTKAGKRCLVLEKRNHIGGNCYTQNIESVNVHKYGAHIFHTSDKEIWDYVNSFVKFNRFTNSPLANYNGELYSLPFNMNTFKQLWGVKTPAVAKAMIEKQKSAYAHIVEPKNLEEQALVLGGVDIYEKLIKGYTEKQWGRSCKDLPAFIIKRLPFRFTYDNNYFNDDYQGIPIGGYTELIRKLLCGSVVHTGIDFNEDKEWLDVAKTVVYTGKIDEYYNYIYGELEYRGLKFVHRVIDTDNFQGNAVVNYTEKDIPYTRIIEHKHFEFGAQPKTVISEEYPIECGRRDEPFYPINDLANNEKYKLYKALADKESNVIFGGRLAEYKYYDMDDIVRLALDKTTQLKML